MTEYKMYLAGKFETNDSPMAVANPYTGENFATIYQAGASDLEKAINAAESVQEELKNMPSYQRYEILMHISRRLTEDRVRLGKVLAQESGKPFMYSVAEIDRSAQTFLVAAEESKRIPGEVMSLDWTPAGDKREGIVKYFPIGLVAGIAPFNFPMNLAVHKLAPAIAAGCPIILKPATATPLSTLELAKIIDETSLPKGAVSILPMNRESGNQLVTDERFKLLSFTGSPVVGWKMKEQAGKKPVVLELGGNAGVIVAESANFDKALDRSVLGAFSYSGQICIHAQRIFVHESHFDRFLEELKKRAEALKVGDPTDESTEFSSMIDEKNAIRMEEWVNEAIDEGATLVSGGKRDGTMYAPTILTNVDKNSKVNAEEAFGPVVVVEKFSNFEDAIHMVNDSVFGLQAGVFTESLRESQMAFNDLEVGGVVINDIPTFRVDHMPYGGVKESGLGREGVKYAMLDMLEPRVMVVNNS